MLKKASLLASCTIFLWASAFVVNRYLNAQMNPYVIVCLRLVFAGMIMLPFLFMIRVRLKDFIDISLIGFTGIAGYSVAIILGQITVDAGTTAFIVSQTPVFSVISAYLFFSRKVNKIVIGGMMLSFAGIALIYWSKNNGEFSIEPGVLWILGAAFAQSIYFVLQKRFLKRYQPLELTALAIVASAIPALLFLPFLQEEVVSIANLALIGYLALFPSIVAYFLWAKAIQS
jgi:drug/metabolite transporter (DMT)-like permease